MKEKSSEKLSEKLSEELRKLQYANQKVKQELVSAPEGGLRLGKSRGKTQYFRYTREDGKQYITKENQGLAQMLAQKRLRKLFMNGIFNLRTFQATK